ncbi:MAG TPA: hypothetical protein VGM93_01570 [Acidimicrobiales bacterium]|jgi:biotin carboxyl carrier protein
MTAVMAHLDGDDVRLAERLVVASVPGIFTPRAPEVFTTEGEIVHEGTVIGVISGPGRQDEVQCFCGGFLMGLLAEAGERVRPGQPLAWLRAIDPVERST